MSRARFIHCLWLLIVVAVCFFTFSPFPSSMAQAASSPAPSTPTLDAVNVEIDYTYGKELTLHAGLLLTPQNNENSTIKEAFLFLQLEGDAEAQQTSIQLKQADSSTQWEVSYQRLLAKQPIPPFTHINYWFGALLDDDGLVVSKLSSFDYIDNRYTWQSMEANFVKVYWYEGNIQLAQEVYHSTLETLTRAKELLDITSPSSLNIYLYAKEQELQSALQLGGVKSAFENKDPALQVILLSFPSESNQPRQLLRILLHQRLGKSYSNLPYWLNEGLAAMLELYPEAQAKVLIQKAYQRSTLIPFEGLCRSFPQDTSGSLLAYAQSASFLQYLSREQGKDALERLVQSYTQEAHCERGFEKTFGVSLKQMELRWQKDTFSNKLTPEEEARQPYWLFLLAALILIPLLSGVMLGVLRNRE